jgi:hypothetical protein
VPTQTLTLRYLAHGLSAAAKASIQCLIFQELLDAIGMSYGGAPAQAPSIATSSSTVSASQALQSSSCSVHELHVRLSENNMPPPDDVRVYSKDLLKLAGLASQPAPYVSPACSEPSSSFDDKVAVSSLVKRVAQVMIFEIAFHKSQHAACVSLLRFPCELHVDSLNTCSSLKQPLQTESPL